MAEGTTRSSELNQSTLHKQRLGSQRGDEAICCDWQLKNWPVVKSELGPCFFFSL